MDTSDVVFLFDVDNTLLDNGQIQADLKTHLTAEYGLEACDRYRAHLENLRQELGYVDYLGALQRFRLDDLHHPEVLHMSSWLADYDFASAFIQARVASINFAKLQGGAVIL